MKHVILGAALSAALAIPAFATDYTIMAPAAPAAAGTARRARCRKSCRPKAFRAMFRSRTCPAQAARSALRSSSRPLRAIRAQLIVGGYVMVGAILTNASPVSLADVTPIARLTGEAVAIVVPAASPIQNINELVEMLKADPGAVTWAGGSAGGVDHITVGLLAKAAGVDPTKINYVAFSGGGEALAAILGNQVTGGHFRAGRVPAAGGGGHDASAGRLVGRADRGRRCADPCRVGL